MPEWSAEDERLIYENWRRTGGKATMDEWRDLLGRPLYFKPPTPAPRPGPYYPEPIPKPPPPVIPTPPYPSPEPLPFEPTPKPPPPAMPVGSAPGLFDCHLCGANFGTTAELADHYATAHPELPIGGGGGEAPVIGGGLGGGIGGIGEAPVAPPYIPSVMPPAGSAGYSPWIEERYGPQAGYMAGLGLYGKAYHTPYQQYQAGMYNPMNFLWNMQTQMEALNRPGYNAPQYLSQFAPQYGQNPFAMYGMARGMMGDVFGMSPEERAGMTGGTYESDLAQLLGLGLRQDLGPGAAWLQGRIPAERGQWQAQYPMQQGPSFLDYITEKYNLGRYF